MRVLGCLETGIMACRYALLRCECLARLEREAYILRAMPPLGLRYKH